MRPGAGRELAAGARDRLVTIEQLSETVGSSGFPIEAWTPLATVYASRQSESGSERFTAANQVSAVEAVRWTLPYRADCDPEQLDVPKIRRVVAQGRVYDITAAAQIGRRRGLEFRTLAKVG